jgi:hypothetical protein
MASAVEETPEKRKGSQERFISQVAWLVGALALLAVGAEAAHDVLTRPTYHNGF